MASKKKLRWGVKWGQVGSGGATFLIAGGITAALWFGSGALYVWPAAIAFIGFMVMLTGLMGEDGVW